MFDCLIKTLNLISNMCLNAQQSGSAVNVFPVVLCPDTCKSIVSCLTQRIISFKHWLIPFISFPRFNLMIQNISDWKNIYCHNFPLIIISHFIFSVNYNTTSRNTRRTLPIENELTAEHHNNMIKNSAKWYVYFKAYIFSSVLALI